MVAGGVQSLEGGPYEVYTPQQSYYQQFYSALVSGTPATRHPKCTCPAPPTTASTTYVPPKHPKCTCPSPPPSSSPSPASTPPPSPELHGCEIGAAQSCTSCPPNSASCGASEVSFLAQPTFRHPRCTCPVPPSVVPTTTSKLQCTCPDPEHNIDFHTRRKPLKHRGIVRAVLVDAPNKAPIFSTDCRHFIKLHHSSNSLTNDILYDSPSSTLQISSTVTSPVLVHRLQNGSTPISPATRDKVHRSSPDLSATSKMIIDKNIKGVQESTADDDIIESCNNSTTSLPLQSPLSSPAKKVKDKFSNLRQRVVSSFTRTSSQRVINVNDTNQRNEKGNIVDTGGFEEDISVAGLRNTDGLKNENSNSKARYATVSSKIRNRNLPTSLQTGLTDVPSPIPCSSTGSLLPNNFLDVFTNNNDDFAHRFNLDELPTPILHDLTSPLGSVPPLSPQSESSSMTLGSTPTQAMSPNLSIASTITENRESPSCILPNNLQKVSRRDLLTRSRISLDIYSDGDHCDDPDLVNTVKSPPHRVVRRLQGVAGRPRPNVAHTLNSHPCASLQKPRGISPINKIVNNSPVDNFEAHGRSQSLVNVYSGVDIQAVLLDLLNSSTSVSDCNDDKIPTNKSNIKFQKSESLYNEKCFVNFPDYHPKSRAQPSSIKRHSETRESFSSVNSLPSSPGASRPITRFNNVNISSNSTQIPVGTKKSACDREVLGNKTSSHTRDLKIQRDKSIPHTSLELSKEDLDILINILQNTARSRRRKNECSDSLHRTRSLDTNYLKQRPKNICATHVTDIVQESPSQMKNTPHQYTNGTIATSLSISRTTSLRSRMKCDSNAKSSIENDYTKRNISMPNHLCKNFCQTSNTGPQLDTLMRIDRCENELKSASLPRIKRNKENSEQRHYENVVFHEAGDYIMLSKQIMDQWKLPYEFTYPSEQASVSTSQSELHWTSKPLNEYSKSDYLFTPQSSVPCYSENVRQKNEPSTNGWLTSPKNDSKENINSPDRLRSTDVNKDHFGASESTSPVLQRSHIMSSLSSASAPTTPTLLELAGRHVGGLLDTESATATARIPGMMVVGAKLQ